MKCVYLSLGEENFLERRFFLGFFGGYWVLYLSFVMFFIGIEICFKVRGGNGIKKVLGILFVSISRKVFGSGRELVVFLRFFLLCGFYILVKVRSLYFRGE